MEDADAEDPRRKAFEPQDQGYPPEPEPPAPGRGRLYFTFGTQYAREPHPAGDWIHPDGYLTVDYALDPEPRTMQRAARERARLTVWTYLEGHYAFEYDEVPDARYVPRGELARVVLP
jgi:hypothetical protein